MICPACEDCGTRLVRLDGTNLWHCPSCAESVANINAEWARKWPRHCRTCGGWDYDDGVTE